MRRRAPLFRTIERGKNQHKDGKRKLEKQNITLRI
jgi:hypothetical protein